MVSKQLKMSEIEALAVAKHGRRAYGMIDEYAEARHAQGVRYIHDKFPEFFGGVA